MSRSDRALPAKVAKHLQVLRARQDLESLGAVIRAAHDIGWTYVSLGRAAGFSRERARQLASRPSEGKVGVDIPAPPQRGRKRVPPKPTLSQDEAAELRSLVDQARTVNGSTHPDDPRRAISVTLTARLVDLVKQGHRVSGLAAAMGVSSGAVYARLAQGGYETATRREPATARAKAEQKLTVADVKAARRAAAAGATVSALARDLGVHHETVAKAVYGETWATVTQPPPLARRKVQARARLNGRLNEAKVAGARRRYVAGETKRSIAAWLRVGEDTVREAIHGVTWQHVTDPPPVARRG